MMQTVVTTIEHGSHRSCEINCTRGLKAFLSFPCSKNSYLNFSFSFPEDYNQVYYLGFDRYNGERLYDDSSHNNNATLMNVQLDKEAGSCGKCAKICCGGQIIIDGSKFVGEL